MVIASGAGFFIGSVITPFIPKMKQLVNNKFQQRENNINEETVECLNELNEVDREEKKQNKFQQCITSIKKNINYIMKYGKLVLYYYL